MADFNNGADPRGHPAITLTVAPAAPAKSDATHLSSESTVTAPPAAPPTLPTTTADYRRQHFSVVYTNPAIAAAGDRLMCVALRSPDSFERVAMLAGLNWDAVRGFLAERCRGAHPDQPDPVGVAAMAVEFFREELERVALPAHLGFWDRLNEFLDDLATRRVPQSCGGRSRLDRMR